MEIITHSEDETADFAARLAGRLGPGDFVALTGALGAGKTAFTRGLARGLGIKKDILSPTFTLLREYHDGRVPLYHFDLYRIASEDELEETGFFDAGHADGITVCEWSDLFPDSLPDQRVEIEITAPAENTRVFRVREATA